MKQINGFIKVRQSLRKHTTPVVEELKILKLNNVWVDVSGLGKWYVLLIWHCSRNNDYEPKSALTIN